jgi:hypothetical protein
VKIEDQRVKIEGLHEEVQRLKKRVGDLVKELSLMRGEQCQRDETTSSKESNDAPSPQRNYE